MKTVFSYDSEMDDLFVYSDSESSAGAVELAGGDIILDFNEEGDPVAIEFLQASKFFKELFDKSVEETRELLENLTKCSANFKEVRNETFLITFRFHALVDGEEQDQTSSMITPEIYTDSPAIAQT